MSREPIRGHYDAIVDFWPPRAEPAFAYALVKRTYEILDDRLEPAPVVPLFHDIRDDSAEPRLAAGSDFWPLKFFTDVVIRGSAYPPKGRAATRCTIAATVGEKSKRIRVWGRRFIQWQGREASIGPPEPFEKMPVTNANAYGGYDGRVSPGPEPYSFEMVQKLEADHPGLYPRNPFGKGYVVLNRAHEGIELPNLEDPDQPLNAENLIVKDPRRWYQQPLPWCFEYTLPLMFHRYCWLGETAWYSPPKDAQLEEVRRGYLPDQLSVLQAWSPPAPPPAPFYQEASLGMWFEPLAAGTPITVEGMHPEHPAIHFELPKPPRIEMQIESQLTTPAPQLTSVLLRAEERCVDLVYAIRQEQLPRVFLPGVHAKVPLSAKVDGDRPVLYQTPATLYEQLHTKAEKP